MRDLLVAVELLPLSGTNMPIERETKKANKQKQVIMGKNTRRVHCLQTDTWTGRNSEVGRPRKKGGKHSDGKDSYSCPLSAPLQGVDGLAEETKIIMPMQNKIRT